MIQWRYIILFFIFLIGLVMKALRQLLWIGLGILLLYLIYDGYMYFTSEVTQRDDGKR